MRAEDLDHGELLAWDPEGGPLRFAGQRALLMDAVAMGILRKFLVDAVGVLAARTALTQFGFAHGWRMADVLGSAFKWDSDDERLRACTRFQALQGLFRVDAGSEGPLARDGVTLMESYEAEQHQLHFGRADAPVCWTLCGLASGYLSRTLGDDVLVLEDRCAGRGDPACRLVGRTRAAWGDEHADDLRVLDPARLKASLNGTLHHVMETIQTADQKLHARGRVAPTVAASPGTVSRSRAMQRVVELAGRVARVDSTVLITGESGSGKERIARLVHDGSIRAGRTFIAVNCGAIPDALLESELFGHVRGAFTGATHDRAGLFEAAGGGTLLLDEIGEISLSMQVKLLRALQEREVRRVGENQSRHMDVRVLASTNRDLAHAVAEGTFRQDLYYRLNVVELHVPPLRERREDVLPLARALLADAVHRARRHITGLAPAAADQLLRYEWPGNVRELENAMERAVALATGSRVELMDLPEEVRQVVPHASEPGGPVRALEEVEKEHVIAALRANGGNQTRTAAQLRIGSATLYRKLKSYGMINGRGERCS
ncbi:MAG: sigma 54-interacting transcriptional regulator [Deltaproteobacteria bacterium]|nr:sigma 54-interacting transcriptional regulator [Deltaproteobacteria bacterium]